MRLLEVFERISHFFYVKADSDPKVQAACTYGGGGGWGLGRFYGIFRTPSFWTLSAWLAAPFFEPSMANSCWSSRAPRAVPMSFSDLWTCTSRLLSARVRKVALRRAFYPHFAAFFALRPHGR